MMNDVDKLDIDKPENVPTNSSNLKSKVDKLYVDKLVPAPVPVKLYVDKIPDITNLATNVSLNAKINEVKGEIPNITDLATTTALTAVENKIPNVSNLGKKTDYNTKINEIENKTAADHDHDKYITTQEFNKLTSEHFTARLKQGNLPSKSDIANFVKRF